jgi:hypothetical protein
MTFLLSIIYGTKRILSAVWGYVTANPSRIAIVALIALCGFLALSNASLRGDVRHVTKLLTSERAAHIATKVNYANAQKIAADMNRKQVEQIENKRKEIASANNAEIRSGIDRAVADARRVWASRAAQSFASGSSASEIAGPAVDTNGASGVSEFFTEDDVRICTVNTLLAKGWQDFYEDLQAASLAVPVE